MSWLNSARWTHVSSIEVEGEALLLPLQLCLPHILLTQLPQQPGETHHMAGPPVILSPASLSPVPLLQHVQVVAVVLRDLTARSGLRGREGVNTSMETCVNKVRRYLYRCETEGTVAVSLPLFSARHVL